MSYQRKCKYFSMEYVGNPGAVPACNRDVILEAFDCSNCAFNPDNKMDDLISRPYVEHRLKILPEYFEAVSRGEKRFELRKDDRNYQVGDHIWLCEWDGNEYTGRCMAIVQIKYILRNCPEYGLMDGYCILGW